PPPEPTPPPGPRPTVEEEHPAGRTPRDCRQAIYDEKRAPARETMLADTNIQPLRRFVDAELDAESIRPI
ncbi:DNA polymerase III subunit gamma/tau C-terminal domain-containing protein, partial [Salmonella enterica subsp. enterica serovar Kentucky]|uniref:DNA polymerase III subunit gamma/tau C-terminal domain-containing protein n=1 Tax=Salmonella enterica TaxID=28901 RepID=UPI003F4C6C4F